jgi:signal transduction histidine kinase
MVSDESIQAAAYELPLAVQLPADIQTRAPERILSQELLTQNVSWFCQLRWLVIAILVCYGALGLFPGLASYLGLRLPGIWPFVTAAVLTANNLIFMYFARSKTSASMTMINLWGQITADLITLTAVVYFVGSLETNIAFAYLFHIVVSCVFFGRTRSLIVTFMAIGLFAVCIAAEYVLKILPAMSIFAEPPFDRDAPSALAVLALNFFLTIAIWIVVWYLASHLSSAVREREYELAETNRRLVAAQEERSRHMLATTHQLKAPFAAIYSNAQLLQQGYCGQLPDEAMQIVQRISSRCRRLSAEIQEMLQLANLSSISQESLARTRIASTDLLLWCISQVKPVAHERGVTFKPDLRPVVLVGAEDHFKMLFVNLLSNAVNYSHRNGLVDVSCRPDTDGRPVVTIADAGIGIAASKLPRIFEEHYRTKEAVRHNKESSGLGLAIVKNVAQMYNIRVRVESRTGAGTRFELTFPTPEERSKDL